MAVKDVLKDSESKMKKVIDSVTHEFAEVHTGRANPALIEEMKIDYYGAPTPMKQVASVTVPDARTIVISPWDPNAIPDIEKGIAASNIGITPNNDGKVIRLTIPALSEERRTELTKVVKDMAEKGRVSLRNVRRDANADVKKLQGDNEISEDESHKAQDDIQKMTDRFIKEVDQILDHKSHELMDI